MKLVYIFVLGMLTMFIIMFMINNNKKHDKEIEFVAKKLIRQSARWATAAKQDNSSMIAVLHANYGAGYLWALKEIMNNDVIEKNTGIDMMKFETEIVKIQDDATMKMAKLCPEYAPEPSYLTSLAGEG